MAKSKESFSKKEKEKKRRKKKQEKAERRKQRKLEKAERGNQSFEDSITYVDEFGHFHDTPPDPSKKVEVKLEDIEISVRPKEEIEEETVRNGRVKFFNEDKGYGFIIDKDSRDSIFVHINGLSEPIRENDNVTFEIEMGPKGPIAVNVVLIK